MIAFEKFKDIQKLGNVVEQHKAWLEDYKDKFYSKGFNGIELMKWKTERKFYKNFDADINKISRKKDRLIIEFDDKLADNKTKDKEKIEKNLQIVKQKLEENSWGYIETTHKGASNYLWIEFTRELTTIEAKSFLKWIAPKDSEVDLNFPSDNFCFPVMFAIHWKHSNNRELPIKFFEGNKINYDALDIKKIRGRNIVQINEDGGYNTFIKNNPLIGKVISIYFNMEDLAEQLYQVNPYFFDQTGMFWLWCSEYKKWNMVDDIDILNMIKKNSNHNTISSKTRNEILEAMKQYGRGKVPLPIKNTWVQFKDTLVDINTGEEFPATPEYFVTNPIPYPLNKDRFEETPNIDKIFEEWVGKENIKKLYQIIAYCLLSDYPIHRIFCFVGAGMNGKSKFLELLRKFIGQDNCCSTELDTLLQSRFEITRLYKKLVCQMGETNFEEMNKTSQLKKLSGGDLIGFEYKGKTPFEEKNYAKIIISTNNLPTTTDKTIGFYRRWMIIDFPNTFSEKKDILKDIPEEEYECLALKSIALLHDLLAKREFYNEGTVEERMERYEARSNFLEKFIRTSTEQDVDSYITKADFFKKFSEWCHENRHRQMSETSLSLAMKKAGIEGSTKYFDWLHEGRGGNARIWIGIKWR